MKTRIIKTIGIVFFFALLFLTISFKISGAAPAAQMFYEIKLYRISGPAQEASMDAFLKDAFIPAVHRAGIATVGVLSQLRLIQHLVSLFMYLFLIKQLMSTRNF
jgi:hypothetical protein